MIATETKVCTACKTPHPATSEFFCADKRHKDGFQSQCRQCGRDRHHRWRQTPKARTAKKRWEQSPKGRTAKKRYAISPKGRTRQKRYRASPKGREAQRKYNAKRHDTLEGKLRTVWDNMNQRCNNPKCPGYLNWGERGIENLFAFFEQFFKCVVDKGFDTIEKLCGLEIHRIDNDGDYESDNITFLTKREHRQIHAELRKLAV